VYQSSVQYVSFRVECTSLPYNMSVFRVECTSLPYNSVCVC